MDIPTFFLQRHSYLHESALPNLRTKLPEAAFRQRATPETPPIIWLLWHMARVEDMGLSRLVWHQPQLYNDDWHERINAGIRHYGTSMEAAEIDALAEQIDVYALLDYQQATAQRTREQLAQLDLARLDEVMEEVEVLRVVKTEGMASEAAQWVAPHYIGKTRGWCLCHMGLTHNFRHFGQIMLIRKMLGYG